MAVLQQEPFIVSVIREETPETTVADVIIGALGLTGVMFLTAVVLGGLVAFGLVLWRKRRRPETDHLPPVSPFMADPGSPPSSRLP